jgi:hypothetical protein
MDTDKTETATGQELLDQGVAISLRGKPAAALIHYRKVSP